MAHKNADNSEEPHHLYEIVDKVDYDIFKYGISCGPISPKDGMSKRMRIQLRFANLIDNWPRFFARVIVRDIPGRKEQSASNASISADTGKRMVKIREGI